MNINIIGEPRFYLGINLKTVSTLIKLSEHHYDPTCRAAGRVGGFLHGWKSLLETQLNSKGVELDREKVCVRPSGSARQLDLTLKLMEAVNKNIIQEEMDLINDYAYSVRMALKRARENKDWCVELYIGKSQ